MGEKQIMGLIGLGVLTLVIISTVTTIMVNRKTLEQYKKLEETNK